MAALLERENATKLEKNYREINGKKGKIKREERGMDGGKFFEKDRGKSGMESKAAINSSNYCKEEFFGKMNFKKE